MKKYFMVVLFISFFLGLNLCSFSIAASEEEQEVTLLVGGLEIVPVSSPQRVSVVDPAVADVDKATNTEVYLVGKGAGTTTLKIWDKSGEKSILVRVFAENLEDLQKRLKQLLSNFSIANLNLLINKDEGKVVVSGEYFEQDKDRVNTVLSPFGERIINLLKLAEEDSLVQIDVQILELTKSAARELGIEWLQSLQIREEPYQDTSPTKTTVDTISRVFRVVEWSRDALTAKIRMLESENKAQVLSRPKLVCLSGKEAEFVVGGEVPIVTTSTTTAGTSQENVEYRQYGVILKIKPVVTEQGLINTEINTEVSEIASWRTIGGSSYPVLTTNNASTQLYLRDGDTVFLAGLIKNNLSKDNISGIPLLMKIPFLGALFRWRDYSKSDNEIVISVTPSIIRQVKRETPAQEKKVSQESASAASSSAAIEESFVVEPIIPGNLSEYASSVQAKIAEAIQYPAEAKQFGWEGTVKLGIHLFSDGNLSEVNIKQSSGYDLFDKVAIEAAKLQSPYPAFPAGIETADLWIDVPITYRID